MQKRGEEAVGVELGFAGKIEKVKVREAEAFAEEGFGEGWREDFVAKLEFAPGETLEFGNGGFERSGLRAGVVFEEFGLEGSEAEGLSLAGLKVGERGAKFVSEVKNGGGEGGLVVFFPGDEGAGEEL